MEPITAYKIVDKDFYYKNFQYKIGETYEKSESLKKGFSAYPSFVHSSHKITTENKYIEVILSGKIIKKDDKYIASKITIVKEIPYEEVLIMCTGKFIFTDKKKHIVIEKYFLNGIVHHENGSAVIFYNDNIKIIEVYFIKGKCHRVNGPAFIEYNNDGKIIKEIYYKNGIQHRVNGPSFIEYNKDGKIIKEMYRVNGKLYRQNGPVFVRYNEYENMIGEYYDGDVYILKWT